VTSQLVTAQVVRPALPAVIHGGIEQIITAAGSYSSAAATNTIKMLTRYFEQNKLSTAADVQMFLFLL